MKKFCITLELLIIILVTIACGTGSGVSENTEYLRIHIRANSNSDYDQSVKYKIRDEIVPYLTPYLADCQSKDEAADVISSLKKDMEKRIDDILRTNGYGYSSSVKIKNCRGTGKCHDKNKPSCDTPYAGIVRIRSKGSANAVSAKGAPV